MPCSDIASVPNVARPLTTSAEVVPCSRAPDWLPETGCSIAVMTHGSVIVPTSMAFPYEGINTLALNIVVITYMAVRPVKQLLENVNVTTVVGGIIFHNCDL